MSVWQPIETAPRDGTGVIITDVSVLTPVSGAAWFYDGKWWCLEQMYRPYPGDDGCPWWGTPTHWMPLPPPPEKLT